MRSRVPLSSLVPTNALGLGMASDRESLGRMSQIEEATYKPLATLPIQIVNDKGRYHSRKPFRDNRASSTFSDVALRPLRPSVLIMRSV
jgi:hypothetical protein